MTTLLPIQVQKTKHYAANQQVKYLHLEAEIDMLLQELTTHKEQKQLLAEISQKTSESAELSAD